jgi:FtsH-binding integral membrane protein
VDTQKIERAVLGFLVGGLIGSGLSYLGLLFFNWLSPRLGREPVEITAWSVLPLGLLIGLSIAINMANPPFGD